MSEPSDGGPGPPHDPEDEQFANFEQTLSVQQKQMSELKEKVLQFEADKREKAASVKLKADECFQKLMNLRSSASKNKIKLQEDNDMTSELDKSKEISMTTPLPSNIASSSSPYVPIENVNSETTFERSPLTNTLPPSQKMLLLKQQTEENKRKMAERINNQKGIAIKVNKLLEQFDNMQTIFNPVVGIALDTDCTDVDVLRSKIQSLERTVSQLNAQLQEARENESIADLLKSNMSYLDLQNELNLDDKCMLQHMQSMLTETDKEKQKLSNQVFDLQENLKEKDSIIDAKTKAITLMSEDLSRKGKNTVDLLEETKLEMVRMQHNFVQIEENLKKEIVDLKIDLNLKNAKVDELTAENKILGNMRDEVQIKLLQTQDSLEKKIKELENENQMLSDSKIELEKTISLNIDTKAPTAQRSPTKSPKKGKKGKKGQATGSVQVPEQNKLTELQNRIQELENEVAEYQQYNTVKDDENTKLREELSASKVDNEEKCKEILLLQESITKLEKEAADPNNRGSDVMKLEQLLDETKANNKKQLKYLQKQVDSFGKISNAHQEVVNLNQKVMELNNKVAELEEEKGNLQLHLVDYDTNKVPDTEMNSKLTELQSICQTQMHSIALLESQKFDLVQDLHIARQQISSLEDELADLTQSEENAVTSQITSIQLEEKLDALTRINDELTQRCDELDAAKKSLEASVEELSNIRNDLTVKLDACLCENEELVKKIDRMERLNAEKVSSAESIEIVDNLTQKEKMEIENFQKGLSISGDDNQETQHEDRTEDVVDMVKPVYDMSEDETDLNISVAKLTEESSDLMEKISVFTQERMEVMARLETLQIENQRLLARIEHLENGTDVNSEEYQSLLKENERLVAMNDEHKMEKDDLVDKLKQLTTDRNVLQDDVNKLLKEIKDLKSNETVVECGVQEDVKQLYESLLEENNNTKQDNERMNQKILELESKCGEFSRNFQNLDEEYQLHKQTTFTRDCEYKDIIYRLEKEQEKYQQDVDKLNRYNSDLIQEMDHMRSDADEDRAITADVYKNQVDILNEEIQRLTNLAKSTQAVDELQAELRELRTQLENNKVQCESYVADLKVKVETINTLNEQIMELYGRVEYLMNENKNMETEINNLMEEASVNNTKINTLMMDVTKKDSEIQKLCEDLQNKQKDLVKTQKELKTFQSSRQTENGKYKELEEANKKLEAKNKENIEKMKKLAANLKKKSSMCAEYEIKLHEAQEKCVKVENEARQQSSDEQSSQLQNLLNDVQLKSEEISGLNAKLIELAQLNHELSQKDLDRNDILNRMTRLEQLINEKEMQNNELMDRINEHKFNYETSLEGIKAKLNEKEVYIESLEIENTSNKEKVSKLIDGIASIEERRCMLEERAEVLDAELCEKSAVCSEFASNEDLLIRRMKALVDEDEILEKKMRMVNEQNEQLNLQIQDLSKQNNDLISNMHKYEEKIKEYEVIVNSLRDTENEHLNLVEHHNQLQSELKRLRSELKEKEELHQRELDEMENEFSAQLQISESERRSLAETLEKHHDSNDCLQDEIVKLKDTIHQLEQNKTDLERDNTWIKLQNDSMLSVAEEAEDLSKNIDEKDDEIRALREKLQQSELMISTGVVNTDNSVIERFQADIAELRSKLMDKDKQIESYQRQNMQLQMAASFGVASEVPFFQSSFQEDTAKNSSLEQENIIRNLEEKLRNLEAILSEKSNAIDELQKLIVEKDNEIYQCKHVESKATVNEVPFFQTVFADDSSSPDKDNIIQNLQDKITNLEMLLSNKTEQEGGLQKITSPAEESFQRRSVPVQMAANEVPLFQTFKQEDDGLQNNLTQKENLIKELHEKIQNLEIIVSVKSDHIDELQKLIIERDNEVTALQSGASSLAMRMEEIIRAYQYLQNEFEKKQHEVNELISAQNKVTTASNDSAKDLQNFDLVLRVQELEELLRQAQSEKEEAFVRLQQLVYDMDNLKKQQFQFDIESQTESRDSKKIFKDAVDVSLPVYSEEGNQEIVEEVMVAKKAYVCEKDEPPEEESGWGFSAEEAFLEESYQNTAAQPTNDKIASMQKQIDDLQNENLKLNEDFKLQQVKLAKSMMKLKEYKNKNSDLSEQLKKLKSSSDGLDYALQEVLTLRIEELENEVRNNKAETDKLLSEKNALNKRVDVLVAANDRMVECKEKQDLEVERLNIHIKQLQSQFHWDSQQNPNSGNKESSEIKKLGAPESSPEDEAKLKTMIRELSIDNDELQALLDDQKQTYDEREKKLSTSNAALTAQVEELTDKIQELRKYNQSTASDEIEIWRKNIQNYHVYIQNIIRDHGLSLQIHDPMDTNAVDSFTSYLEAINAYINTLKEKNHDMNDLVNGNQSIINNLNQQISDKCVEIENLQTEIKTVKRYKVDVDELNKQLSEKCTQITELQKQCETLNQSNENAKKLYEDINELQNVISQNNTTITELNRLLEDRNRTIGDLHKHNEALVNSNTDVQNLQKYIHELQNAIDSYKIAIDNLNAESMEKSRQIELLQISYDESIKLQKQNEELQVIIAQQSNTISDLQNAVAENAHRVENDNILSTATNNDVMNLQQENLNLKQIIEQNKNIIDDLNSRLFNITTQFERLQTSTAVSHQNVDANVALQEYKNKVNELNALLDEKTRQVEQLQKQCSAASNNNEEILQLRRHVEELNLKLVESSKQLENLQLVSDNDSHNRIQELNSTIENNRCLMDNLQATLSEKTLRLEQLQNEYNLSVGESNRLQQHTAELNTALEQNRCSIESLNAQLADRLAEIENLEQGRNQKQEEIKSAKITELENNLRETNEQWTQLLEQRCHEIADSWKIHLVEVESKFSEKQASLAEQNAALQQRVDELNTEIDRLNSIPKNDDELALLRIAVQTKQEDVEQLTKECEDLRSRVQEYETDIRASNERLVQLVEEINKTQDKSVEAETKKWSEVVNRHQDEYRQLGDKYEELEGTYQRLKVETEEKLKAKDSELENLRQLLDAKSKELEVLTIEMQDLAVTLEEERKKMDSMRSALESQELELVTLKERTGREVGVAAVEEVPAVVKEDYKLAVASPSSSEQSPKPKQAELDLALYMLHQRDMRCEELTLEVVSLLEERDTLQLRLSNAIRVNEAIAGELVGGEAAGKENIDGSNRGEGQRLGAGARTASDTSVSLHEETAKGATVKKTRDFEMLKNKLSELHALDHSRDLRISDDRRLRQQQQMAMVERDYDKLPEEAKQKLIDADYTLSRDYQSPSTSLLNWLWGKGTRKVEHL